MRARTVCSWPVQKGTDIVGLLQTTKAGTAILGRPLTAGYRTAM